jgi:hypothetical protein
MGSLQVIDLKILQPCLPTRQVFSSRSYPRAAKALAEEQATKQKIACPDFTSGSFVFEIKHLQLATVQNLRQLQIQTLAILTTGKQTI